MPKRVKIYKPSHEEILKNVVGSFEIENIKISYATAKKSQQKILNSMSITKKAFIQRIEKAEAQIKKGQHITIAALKKESETW